MGVELAQADGRMTTDMREKNEDNEAREAALAVEGFGGQLALAACCF